MTAVAVVVPFLATLAVIALLLAARWSHRLTDRPNERSLHEVPTRRLGGIGIALGALPIAAALGDSTLLPVLGLAALLAVVSLWDDLRALPASLRLAGHVAANGMVVGLLAPHDLGVASTVALVLALAWMTNLYNFMDGSDGLAGGMAVIGFSAYSVAASLAAHSSLALATASIASAAAGFLAYNFPPARVFLGDSGSIPLGFLAGAIGLYGVWAGAWPATLPLLVFSPFIVDASVTLVRRLAHREAVWRAHREHAYQRLVLSGWSPRKLALCAYAWMGAAASSALLLRSAGLMLQCGILVGWGAAYAAALIVIDRRTAAAARNSRAAERSIG